MTFGRGATGFSPFGKEAFLCLTPKAAMLTTIAVPAKLT